MQNDLLRVEAVEIAINQGITANWSQNHVLAHGLAGQKNPLGNALVHLEASITRLPNGHISYSGGAFNLAKFHLASELLRTRVCESKDSHDYAEYGLRFFVDKRCPCCQGTGVINIEQETCQMCGGSKTKPASELTKKVYMIILGYMEWMEAQLDKKLKGWTPEPVLASAHVFGRDIGECGTYSLKHRNID